jgi:hypothetical protein
MNNPEEKADIGELKIDIRNLYREENYTDLKVGAIKQLIPVKMDGSRDASRAVIFSGETQIMTPNGPLPLHFPLEANSFQEAVDAFPEAVRNSVESMIEEVRELQRKEASRIIVPNAKIPPEGKIKF